ncbi:MAG: hypothetical protein IPG87_15865 [Saprospiraceae bacterium]|nr:hypothetical protein [Candidatus Vicinibacter affinis]
MKNSILNYFTYLKLSQLVNLSRSSWITKSLNLCIAFFLITAIPASSQVMLKGMAVVTRYADTLRSSHTPALIIDVRNNSSALSAYHWSSANMIYPTNWTKTNLGQVFGTAIDKNYNIYLSASDVYRYDNNSLSPNPGPGGCAGIYKASSANLSNLTTIINTTNAGSISIPSNTLPCTGGVGNGIGNIAYDRDHHQMFVTNLEDGRIYRVNLNTNQVISSYDPFGIDAGNAGMPVVSERLWGIGINKDPLGNSRIYFAREPVGNSPHEIWSVPLSNSGEFMGPNLNQVFYGSENFEVFIPNSNLGANSIYHNKITDLAFSSNGALMLAAERGNPFLASTYQYKTGSFTLIRRIPTGGGGVSPTYPDMNSAGGVDFGYREGPNGYFENCDTMIWATANLNAQPAIVIDIFSFGIIGTNSNTGQKLAVVDFDGSLSNGGLNDSDIGKIGDVEIARDPCTPINYTLACDNHLQVSLDSNCCATITPGMVVEGNYPLNCIVVILKDQYGRPIPGSPTVCSTFIGQTLQYEVLDTCTKNRCWGTLTIEDKLPPQIVCEEPDTVFCNHKNYSWAPPIVFDNCTGIAKAYILSDLTVENSCDSFCIAERQIQYYYIDAYGNRSDTCLKKSVSENSDLRM